MSRGFGTQCTVLLIEAKKPADGRKRIELGMVEWMWREVELGVVLVSVIASGGTGSCQDMVKGGLPEAGRHGRDDQCAGLSAVRCPKSSRQHW